MRKRKFNPLMVAGAILVFAIGIGFFITTQSFQKTTAIVEAKSTLSPFIAAQPNQLESVAVPQASVTANDLTWANYQANYVSKNAPLIPTMTVLDGDRLDQRLIAAAPQSSFATVLPDERVIAVTTSVPGAVLGVVQPGDVVDVQTAGNGVNGSQGSQFAKVLCASGSAKGCEGVLPSGVALSGVSSSSSGGQSNPVNVLLVVQKDDAAVLAGQSVTMSLNPFCAVGADGHFVSLRKDEPCQAPADRLASQPSKAPAATTNAGTTNGQTSTQQTTTTAGTQNTPGK